jgi:hypothetical protein
MPQKNRLPGRFHEKSVFFFPLSWELSAIYSPGPFADSWRFTVTALPSADTPRPESAAAALLDASGSKDSHRGPYQQA